MLESLLSCADISSIQMSAPNLALSSLYNQHLKAQWTQYSLTSVRIATEDVEADNLTGSIKNFLNNLEFSSFIEARNSLRFQALVPAWITNSFLLILILIMLNIRQRQPTQRSFALWKALESTQTTEKRSLASY